MSADPVFKRCMAAGVLAWTVAGTGNVYARDWMEMVSTPLTDPLLVRPPQLALGKALPGDTEALACTGHIHDSTKPLTLSDALDLALCHNPQVQSAWAASRYSQRKSVPWQGFWQ